LRISAGAAQPNLSTAQIKAFEIPVPSLQEQDRVVVRLNDLNDKCKALQDNYQKTLTLCDDLKQSLLRKAFNGEL
jgi:type I restriction enzyme S subunit